MARYKLGDICEIVSGSTPKTSVVEYWDGDNIWITPAEIEADSYIIDDSERKISDEGVRKTGLISFPKGTVILSSRAPIGKVAIAGCEMYCNQGFKNLVCSDKIYNEYLYWFLKKNTNYLNSLGRGATFKEISKTIVSDIEIDLPEMDEQVSVSNKLKAIRAYMDLRQRQLEQLDTLIKARFVEMFGDPSANPMGWEQLDIGQLMTVEPQNGLYKPQTDYVPEGGAPILRIDAFYGGKVLSFEKLKRLKCSEEEIQRYSLCEDDIVVNRVNSLEYLGKCAHISGLNEPTVYESNMMRFHLDDGRISAVFATHMLCSEFVYHQILKRAKKAVNQASINQGDVKSICMPVPPLNLQNQFVAFVSEVDKSKFYEEACAALVWHTDNKRQEWMICQTLSS